MFSEAVRCFFGGFEVAQGSGSYEVCYVAMSFFFEASSFRGEKQAGMAGISP